MTEVRNKAILAWRCFPCCDLICLCLWWGTKGFPCGKESACNVGDPGPIPGLGGSPGEGKSYPLQYSGMENSMDCTVHGVAKSWTRLNDFHFHQGQIQVFRDLKLSLVRGVLSKHENATLGIRNFISQGS